MTNDDIENIIKDMEETRDSLSKKAEELRNKSINIEELKTKHLESYRQLHELERVKEKHIRSCEKKCKELNERTKELKKLADKILKAKSKHVDNIAN